MRVGLNCTCLNDRPSGAKQRFIGIYRELFSQVPDAEFIIFEPRDCRVSEWFSGNPNVRASITPISSVGGLKNALVAMPYWLNEMRREKVDLIECFHLPVFPLTGRRILTVHDLRWLRSSRVEAVIYKSIFSKMIKSLDQIVTVSQNMKDEILREFPQCQVAVVPNGVDVQAFRADEMAPGAERQLNAFGLSKGFLLSVGHLEARKNYGCLLDAIATLRSDGWDLELLIIGNDSGGYASLKEKILSNGLETRVKVLSNLSDQQVRAAYNQCRMLVFPSKYEGFGIPVLEAMAAQRPMILSDIAVFREITEDRSVYFDPESPRDLAQKMAMLLSSAADQSAMIEYGKSRVEAFTFPSLAARLARIYRDVL